MEDDTFIFKIEMPQHKPDADVRYQMAHVFAKYPQYVYKITLDKKSMIAEDEQIKLAITKLKHRLMQEILNAELIWEKL